MAHNHIVRMELTAVALLGLFLGSVAFPNDVHTTTTRAQLQLSSGQPAPITAQAVLTTTVEISDYFYASLPPIPTTNESVEVVWTLREPVLREFIIVNGVAKLNIGYFKSYNRVDRLSRDRRTFVEYIVGTDPSFCNLRVPIRQYGDALYIRGRRLPLEFIHSARHLSVNVEPLIQPGGGGPVAYPSGCCNACLWVHDKLNVHEYDCWCCLRQCGFICTPVFGTFGGSP